IQPVKDSFQAFRNLERELGILRDQQERLQRICDTDQERMEAERDRALHRHLEAELRKEAAAEELAATQARVAELDESLRADRERLQHLETQLAADRASVESLRLSLTASEEGRLFLHLRDKNRKLAAEIE